MLSAGRFPVLHPYQVYSARDTCRVIIARIELRRAIYSGMISCPECAEPTQNNSTSSPPAEHAKAETEQEVVSVIPEDPGPEPDPGPGMALLPASKLLSSRYT